MKAMQPLTARQLRDLRAELLEERARLERSRMIDRDTLESPESDSSAVTATQSVLGVAVHSRARARYDAIIDALSRLAGGSYGTCAGCSGPIPYGRLIVMPEVTHCMTCSSRG
jgi:DnaK suppressor protein